MPPTDRNVTSLIGLHLVGVSEVHYASPID
jgi:hypothetical protein